MRRKLISAVITLSMLGSTMGFGLTANAYGTETITNNFESGQIGNEVTGGAFAHYGNTNSKETLVYAANDSSINPGGGNVAVKYVQGTTNCNENTLWWSLASEDRLAYGDCRVSFDLYRTSTAYEYKVTGKSKPYTNSGNGWNYGGIGDWIKFGADGNITALGTNVGKYSPGLYKIAIDFVRSQKKIVVTLIDGKLGNETKTNYKLAEQTLSNEDSASIGEIYFIQNSGKATTSANGMVDYIDNISRTPADNTFTSKQIVDGYVESNTSAITFTTPRFIDPTTMSGVKLMRNGTEEVSYSVSYAKTATNGSNNYSCDPTFTFDSALQGGSYTLSLSNAKDNYGMALSDISFTVLGDDDKCTITVGGGLTLTGDVIGNVLKGTTPSDLLANVVVPTGANAVVNGGAYLFGGETLTVTSANGNYSKTYTIEAKADSYSYNFNDSKLATELASNEIPNAANRNGNPGTTLNKAFPTGKFTQFWGIDTNTAGTAQITGAISTEKSDRVGAISLVDYVNAAKTGNIRMSTTLISSTAADKHYAVNISVKPAEDELTKVGLLKKDQNGATIGIVEFDASTDFAIKSGDAKIKKSNIDDWYDITFDYVYDSSAKKYTVKTFVNGEYVTVRETAAETYEEGIGINIEFYVPLKDKATTKSLYFDNITAYECAAMTGNACPSNTYVPTESEGDMWLTNKAGRISMLAKDTAAIISGINIPSGAAAKVVAPNGDERTGKAETGDRLVITNGENVRTYYIDCGKWSRDAETTTVAFELPQDIPENEGKWIMGVYNADKSLIDTIVTDIENGNLVYRNDDNNVYEVFLWRDIVNITPLASSVEYTSR